MCWKFLKKHSKPIIMGSAILALYYYGNNIYEGLSQYNNANKPCNQRNCTTCLKKKSNSGYCAWCKKTKKCSLLSTVTKVNYDANNCFANTKDRGKC